ncbi:MAG: hypothetical protein HOW97_34695 [Catenulispora sp.]|nr:hypothetical protein [Catenulispora sp.]
MNRADRPGTGGDGQDGDADPAPPPRPYPSRGLLPWAAGGAAVLAQTAIVVSVSGHWRGAGAVLLAVLTLGVVGVAALGRRR